VNSEHEKVKRRGEAILNLDHGVIENLRKLNLIGGIFFTEKKEKIGENFYSARARIKRGKVIDYAEKLKKLLLRGGVRRRRNEEEGGTYFKEEGT